MTRMVSSSGWTLVAILWLLLLPPFICSAQRESYDAAVSRIDDQHSSDSVVTASTATIGLSLEKAIQIAIENNLNTSLARERKNEAHGLKRESRAPLLPNLSSGVFQSNNT